jgi:hypothetical protein
MKLALTTATLAAGALAIAMSASPVNAAATRGHQKWCASTDHPGNQLNVSCRYDTLAACNKAATPTGGKCIINPKWASIKKNSTTGMGAPEK